MKQGISNLIAAFVVTCAPVMAGVAAIPVPSISMEGTGKMPVLDGSIGLGLAVGQFSASLPGISPVDKYVASARCDMKLIMGSFHMETRYEHIETDLAELEWFRFLLNIQRSLFQRLLVFGGLGYGHQTNLIEINGDSLKFSENEILLNSGVGYEMDPFLFSLGYIHCLNRSSKAAFRSNTYKFNETNVGSLEAKLDYRIGPDLYSCISVETQLMRGTVIQKNYLVAFGLTYKF